MFKIAKFEPNRNKGGWGCLEVWLETLAEAIENKNNSCAKIERHQNESEC